MPVSRRLTLHSYEWSRADLRKEMDIATGNSHMDKVGANARPPPDYQAATVDLAYAGSFKYGGGRFVRDILKHFEVKSKIVWNPFKNVLI